MLCEFEDSVKLTYKHQLSYMNIIYITIDIF